MKAKGLFVSAVALLACAAWAGAATVHLEAEDYKIGGEGVGYHDTSGGNSGNQYRSDDVDIENCSEGGFNVGWTAGGEWQILTTDPGTWQTNPSYMTGHLYEVTGRVAASPGGTHAFHVEIDGVDVTGSMTLGSTGGWQNWIDVTALTTVPIAAGPHETKLVYETDGFNANYVELAPVVPEPATLVLVSLGGVAAFLRRRRAMA